MVNYAQYVNYVVRAEYKNFYRTSVLNFNNPNKETEFNIALTQNFVVLNFSIINISGTLIQAEGNNSPAGSN